MSQIEEGMDWTLPSGDEERAKFENAMTEVQNAMRRMDGEKTYISETIKMLSKEHKIPGKALRKICKMKVNGSYQQENDKIDAENELYEALYQKGAPAVAPQA